jgi:hypothetical protein
MRVGDADRVRGEFQLCSIAKSTTSVNNTSEAGRHDLVICLVRGPGTTRSYTKSRKGELAWSIH